MRANHPHTQDRFRTSQATKQRLAARIPSVAGRINNRIQPCEGGTRDYAYDNINLYTTQTEATTALRVSTAARCTMHEQAATTGSKTMRAAALTLRIGSNTVRWQSSDSQSTSIQSQVGCNRTQPCKGGTRDCPRARLPACHSEDYRRALRTTARPSTLAVDVSWAIVLAWLAVPRPRAGCSLADRCDCFGPCALVSRLARLSTNRPGSCAVHRPHPFVTVHPTVRSRSRSP